MPNGDPGDICFYPTLTLMIYSYILCPFPIRIALLWFRWRSPKSKHCFVILRIPSGEELSVASSPFSAEENCGSYYPWTESYCFLHAFVFWFNLWLYRQISTLFYFGEAPYPNTLAKLFVLHHLERFPLLISPMVSFVSNVSLNRTLLHV